MRIVASEFTSLDGVVQAPGGPEEDTDGGFAHGGWSHPFFDPEVVAAEAAERAGSAPIPVSRARRGARVRGRR